MNDFETRTDGQQRWLGATTSTGCTTLSIVDETKQETISTRIDLEEIKDLALWLIDAYEETGLDFPGLERL